MKPKEIKPAETNRIRFDIYFLNGLAEIRKSVEPIDFNNLIYRFEDPNLDPISFIGFRGPQHIFKSIHDADMALEDVEKDKKKLKSNLGHINQGPKNKNKNKE